MADFLALLVTKERKGADTAAAGTLAVPVTGDRFDITGTTGITSMTTGTRGIGARFYLRFTGIVTLTNGADLVLNGGANITTAAGDLILFEVTATDKVQQVTPYGVTGTAGAAGAAGSAGADGADGSPLPRVTTDTSSATPTPNANTTDQFILTAQAATAAFANPTGTPASGQKLFVEIYSAAAQTISWGTDYVARGYALPLTTVAGKWTGVLFIYSAAASKFAAVGGYQEE